VSAEVERLRAEAALRLGAGCAGCGHAASFHPSAEHAAAYLKRTDGQYAASCSGKKGNEINQFGPVACRCRATREQVSDALDRTEP
jgi:hypothetical protein